MATTVGELVPERVASVAGELVLEGVVPGVGELVREGVADGVSLAGPPQAAATNPPKSSNAKTSSFLVLTTQVLPGIPHHS